MAGSRGTTAKGQWMCSAVSPVMTPTLAIIVMILHTSKKAIVTHRTNTKDLPLKQFQEDRPAGEV